MLSLVGLIGILVSLAIRSFSHVRVKARPAEDVQRAMKMIGAYGVKPLDAWGTINDIGESEVTWLERPSLSAFKSMEWAKNESVTDRIDER